MTFDIKMLCDADNFTRKTKFSLGKHFILSGTETIINCSLVQ